MNHYFDTVINSVTGKPLPGAEVSVLLNGSLATIYADLNGTPTSNPVATDNNGLFSFYATDNTYSLEYRYSGALYQTVPAVTIGRGFITPDDFPGTDTQKLQAALNAKGLIRLTRSYAVASVLTIYGDTQVIGAPGAKLAWSGPTTGNILQDGSAVNATQVNLNILLQDFEIDGGQLSTGDTAQVAVNFYRTGNVTIRGLKVHGVGGSGIRWGNSYLDTQNVVVENCQVYDCRTGDAIQGSGRKVTVRNNKVGVASSATSNFGDTGIALIADFNSVSNPSGLFSSDIEITGNTVIGNYNASGAYVGTGGTAQTGIAFGPFNVGASANIRVSGNTITNCYVNLWGIVMDDVTVSQNAFGPHAATATGNVRIDGITNARIRNNSISLGFTGTGSDYSAILLVAQRNVYGASKFDADLSGIELAGNVITSSVTAKGIRATFEQINTTPTYTSKLLNSRFEGNTFNGVTTPIELAPATGSTANVCSDVVIRGNKVDASATCIVSATGASTQYSSVRLFDNPAQGTVAPLAGAGSSGLLLQHKTSAIVSAPTGTTTAIFTLPSGYYGAVVRAEVPGAGSAAFSALIEVQVNGGSARISRQSDGGNLALTLSTLTVSANQTTGSTNNVRAVVSYL